MSDATKTAFKRLLFSLSISLFSIIYEVLNNARGEAKILATIIDDKIPVIEWFSIPYLYWYAYVFIILLYFAIVNSKVYYKLIFSILFGMSISYIIFLFFPTQIVRPEVLGDNVFGIILGLIYSSDNVYNCLPSIHVLNTLFASSFFVIYNRRKVVYVLFAVVSSVMIILSTVFIKQHYVLDVLTSVVLYVPIFIFFNKVFIFDNLSEKVKNIMCLNEYERG